MLRLAQSVILSAGWNRRLIAFCSGAAGALALAPFGLFPAFFLPMTVAVWLIDGANALQVKSGPTSHLPLASIWMAVSAGWWLGFGYFVAGLWWIGSAFLVEADQFAWAMPLGVVCLPALLACFTGLGFGLARLLWCPGRPRILALAIGLGLSEWLRGHILTGFPWNDLGMVLGSNLYLAQFASLAGLYGLTVLSIMIFAMPACLVDGPDRRASWAMMPMLALAGLAGFGIVRLAGPEPGMVNGVRLRIMQPNVQHDLKFRAAGKAELVSRYLALSDQATSPQNTGLADVTHLVWPESAFPFILSRDAESLARIGSALPQGTTLLAGAARLGAAKAPDPRPPIYNSIQVIASGGSILDSYDKVHLVPFGEYVPLEGIVRAIGLQQFVLGAFEPGSRRSLLSVPGLPPVAPLICYEAIFSGEVVPNGFDASGGGAGLFLNVTDDSWFGTTPGPHQHLALARLRTIEEGVPMIRAADTGISAVIDAYGRVLQSLPLGSEGVLDSGLPKAITPPLFARFRLVTSVTIWLFALFSYAVTRFRI